VPGRLADGSGGVDNVVHQQAGTPGDITDDLVHLHQVGDRRVVALVMIASGARSRSLQVSASRTRPRPG
jgi:hypothetical protein